MFKTQGIKLELKPQKRISEVIVIDNTDVVTNVDEIIEEMISRTKGKYITQGVAFNKECPRQMALLRAALSESASFSGLVKEMLAIRYSHQLSNIHPLK